MIDHATARLKVQEILAATPPAFPSDEWIILDSATIEHEWGWVFYWHSRQYQETRDFKYQIAGNAPYIVRRSDGAVLTTGTALPIESDIEQYQRDKKLP